MKTHLHRTNWAHMPRLALGAMIVLLLASVGLALHGDRVHRAMEVDSLRAQLRIVAASLPAALAFADEQATRDYVGALMTNPRIVAAGAYGSDGTFVAGFERAGRPLPPTAGEIGPPREVGGTLLLVSQVTQGEMVLGTVFMEATTDPLSLRLTRYGGMALVVLMAALLVGVLGVGQAALARAHGDLGRKAADLEIANARLQEEMVQRERAEESLRQAQKVEAVGQLTGGVAHDFNNLLQALSGCLQMIRRRAPQADISMFLDAGDQAVERGARLTQQLLAFARRQTLQPEPMNIHDRLLAMTELLTRALRADIRLELDLKPGLWPVMADATQMELAILNLVVNARDALPSGGLIRVEGRNRPGTPDTPDMVEIIVRDTGIGMTADVMERAFDPFYTTKGVGKGSGLGLSQVYGFAAQSGGTARIDSMPGSGTAVSVLLPRAETDEDLTPVAAATLPAAQEALVLLVEDDPITGPVLAATLEDLGYSVERVSTGEEAAHRLAAEPIPDLLLSDVLMPGRINGMDLAVKARQTHPDLPILLLTGYSDVTERGDFRILRKPCTRSDLAAAMHEVMSAGRTAA